MQLDELTLRLRPRGPWEAMDLGAALLRANWKPVLAAWLALVLPVVALIYALGPAPSNWIWLMVWWLKPLFDRIPLYVLSRAVFGDAPRLHEVIRALPSLLRTGVFAGLTYLRLDPWRSFNMPVRVLEGLRGRDAGQRGQVLRKRAGGYAFWLTVVCLIFWIVMSFALIGLMNMFTPDPTGKGDNEKSLWQLFVSADKNLPLWAHYASAALDFIAFSVVELLYVASGFTLYLNRRILLEGWDIEVALRALAARAAVRQEKQPWAAAATILLIVIASHQEPALASDEHSKEIIQKVLAAPEFEQYEEVTRWRYVGPQPDKPDERKPWRAPWAEFGVGFAQFARALVWVLLALAVVAIAWRISRWRADSASDEPQAAKPPPSPRSGKSKAPAPLPHDIVAAAQALLAAAQVRDALGLMYRAAALQLGAPSSDTEADCLRRARAREQSLRDYVTQLVRAWQRAAYAHEASADQAQLLLGRWREHFPAHNAGAQGAAQ